MGKPSDEPPTSPTKVMRLRYAATCRECGAGLAAGTTAAYDTATKAVRCLSCGEAAPHDGAAADAGSDAALLALPAIGTGTAGGSARREYERRKGKRQTRIREAHPRLGGLILALSDDPQSTTAWAQGARGEELLGARLDSLEASGVRVLHDRRIPRTRANIDHIAVTPTGVHVIDAKRYKGKRPELRVEGRPFSGGTEKLYVGSREHTSLVDGVLHQVDVVRAVLRDAGLGEVPARGVLCFIEADWPIIGGAFVINDVAVLWPKKLAAQLAADGPLGAETIGAAQRVLAEALPPA